MKNNIENVIEKLKKAFSDDLPETYKQIFGEAKDEYLQAHDHQSLCTLLSSCMKGSMSRNLDVINATEDAIKMATQEGNKAMEAVYHLIAGKILPRWDFKKTREYFNKALADPEFLASVRTDDFKWVEKKEDSKIFGNDLLSFIGMETERYDVMYDYYITTGNRMAACYSKIHAIINQYIRNEEKYASLMGVIDLYGDLPVVCEAVKYIIKNNLIPKSEDEGLEGENENAERKRTFIKHFVDKFIDDEHTKELESLMRELEKPLFESDFDKVVVPRQDFSIPLKYRNVKTITVTIYPTNLTGRNSDTLSESLRSYTKKATPVLRKTFELEAVKPYIAKETQLELNGLPPGIYLIELKSDQGDMTDGILHVSNIIAIAEHLPNRRTRIVVVDNMTGRPIPHAKVDLMDRWENHTKKTLSCNKNGEIIHWYIWKNSEPTCLFPYTDEDMFCLKERISFWSAYSYDNEERKERVEILTDREIYRPGQTIRVGIVSYAIDEDKKAKTFQKAMKVELKKFYSKIINSINVRSDEMGVAHCEFIIPEDMESGRYTISCGHESKDIRIEEYKRPSFEVKWEDYADPYQVGDTITLKGVAVSYAGVPVANAKVNYRVKRAEAWWWRFLSPYWEVKGLYGMSDEKEYHQGMTETDDNGKFSIEVPMLLTDERNQNPASQLFNGKHSRKSRPLFMDIIAEADVVDSTGETQSARTRLPLSNRKYYMSIQMDEKTELSDVPSFVVVIKNASGKDLADQVSYWLDDSTNVDTATSNQQVSLPDMAVGKHVLHIKYGEEEQAHEFIVFDKESRKVPFETEMWTYQSAEVFPENNGEVILQVGCSEENSYLFYNIFSGNHLLESGVERVASGMTNRRFSYKKEYGNGILVSYAWVRNKKMQTHNFVINKPIPKRELKLSWKTFRDKVVPGTKEKWVLTIKDEMDRNVTANVIATLYDKSLDQLVKSSWEGFGPVMKWNVPSSDWVYSSIETIRLYFSRDYTLVDVPYLFSRFKYGSLFDVIEEERAMMAHRACYKMEEEIRSDRHRGFSSGSVMFSLDSSATKLISEEVDVTTDNALSAYQSGDSEENNPIEEIKLRSDMSETAFFMPTLRTDEDGDVSIEFLLPDSLTTWKFKAIAHTKDMYHAYFEDETIARKLVMVKPNMPRFVRVGDESTISAKVTNTSDKDVEGKIVFELLDASNEQVAFSDSKPFILGRNASLTESFHFTPDEEIEDYVCRIYAVGNGFSDGEQHSLPVLPNKTEVTVTRIISQDGAGTETIDTARLLPEGSTRRRLSLQYTNRPLWLAIKALPAMTDEDSDNAISVSVSLYCNLLTAHLQKHVKEFGSLVSVKSSKLNKSTNKLVGKLKQLQGYGGGFTWYKGMPESLYMTTEVLMHLCRLQKFVGEMDALKDIIENAFRFCDMEMCNWVRELKKREKKGEAVYMPTFTILQHMYNCAITRHVLDDEAKKAYEYLVVLLMKDIHRQTIREKALTALILEYSGHHERAMVYAESLRQYTKCDAERGRTFDTSRATFSWYSYKIPTHVAGMEALRLLCLEDKGTFREMQKWLLQEKRTQMWETPIDSVNAVHALLLGSEEVLSDNRPAVFDVDGKRLDVVNNGNEGYVEADLAATTKQLSIEKVSKGLSWGAVFARFLQPMSDVDASGSGMTIHREIIADKKELHVGDRIRVKLTYTCERNFDFVTVIDSKAACMEPVEQLSWSDSFKHVAPRDTETCYSYYGLGQGTHSIETEYYLDRPGVYEIGVATIVCTYAPEFRAICPSEKLVVKEN